MKLDKFYVHEKKQIFIINLKKKNGQLIQLVGKYW